jgi:hypothetical protein
MRGWVVRDATGDRSKAAAELAALIGELLR